jgi:hypothetical protein
VRDFSCLTHVNSPGSIQTARQLEFVRHFELHINRMRLLFPLDVSVRLDLPVALQRQRELLHGPERQTLRNIPKVQCTAIRERKVNVF